MSEAEPSGGKNTIMDDPNYVIQGSYDDGRICEEDGRETEADAIACARRMLASLTFEGTQVRVITRDGEFVFERIRRCG